MSEFDDIMAIVNAAKISLANIAQDILDIKNSIPPSGGMNAEQTAALRLSVTELNASLNALDLENPPPVTP